MNNPYTDNDIIHAYLTYYRTQDKTFDWAQDMIEQRLSAPDSLQLIFNLILACENEEELAYVAAGPLETLIEKHHNQVQNTLDTLVRQHAVMRRAVQGVWLAEGSPARKTLDNILLKYDLHYGSL
ncbi:MAG: hypothetical protein BGO43_09755 [Gammaproteobacteria bacterium 39-13]|nr:hypothetical protein [Gammaproteobacteria bacterium]OJV93922.1 MAG: hypothetical protein BGO43_09755 [Gammaproteobacteria bacterium 39-13]